MTETYVSYRTEHVTAPGETIADLLEECGMSQKELALRMGRPVKTVNEIINGKAAITPETAVQLENVLKTPADYWLTHDAHYRAYLARRKEETNLEAWFDWLDKMPIRELKAFGKLPNLHNRGRNKVVLLRSLLAFFAVASPAEWEAIYGALPAAYRRSQPERSDPYATAAWLRFGELQALSAPDHRFEHQRFMIALSKIRALTLLPPQEFEPQLRSLCAEAGVVLALVPAMPRARVSGAARRLSNRALIQLSLYGKTNDRFWFTFFHEAGHILLHSQKLVFLDDTDANDANTEEREANAFAAQWLIPSEYEAELPTLRTKEAVSAFADRIGIHPGIVAGRLQHEGLIEPSWLNDLKETLDWRSDDAGTGGMETAGHA